MVGWILGLLGAAGNTIAGVANAATQRILAVFNFVINYFNRVRASVVGVYNTVRALLAAWTAHVISVFTTLKFIVQSFVPKLLAALSAQITAWVKGLVSTVETLARQLAAAVEARVRAIINTVAHDLTALGAWAAQQVHNLLGRITNIENRLFGLLGSADHIANYIVDAMAHALGRWALNNAKAVGRALWRLLLGNLTGVMSIVEDIITSII